MALTSTTAYMNLILPSPSIQLGPLWATQINQALTVVDGHTHLSGSGNPIQSAALNINADVAWNSFNLTLLRSVRFQAQSSQTSVSAGTDIGCIFVAGADLWYNDTAGTQVRITAGGAVNVSSSGQITGMSGTTATASYSAITSTFTFQSNTNVAASMDVRNLVLRNSTASSKGLTLSPPAAMSADYSLTMPSYPVSQKIMTLDAAGIMSAPYVVDNSTLEISSNTIQVKDLGITTAKLANSAVTTAKIADANVTNAKMAANSVSTSNLIDASVTNTKLATDSVTSAKIADSNVTTAKIQTSVSLLGTPNIRNSSHQIVCTNANYSAPIAMVAGGVNGAGASANAGFTSSKGSTGSYIITFTNAFTTTPAILLTLVASGSTGGVIFVNTVSTTGATVGITNLVGSAVDNDFTIAAFGLI